MEMERTDLLNETSLLLNQSKAANDDENLAFLTSGEEYCN